MELNVGAIVPRPAQIQDALIEIGARTLDVLIKVLRIVLVMTDRKMNERAFFRLRQVRIVPSGRAVGRVRKISCEVGQQPGRETTCGPPNSAPLWRDTENPGPATSPRRTGIPPLRHGSPAGLRESIPSGGGAGGVFPVGRKDRRSQSGQMHCAELQPLAGMDGQQPHSIDAVGGRWHLAQLFFVAECLETSDPPQQLLPGIAVAGRLVFGRELQS